MTPKTEGTSGSSQQSFCLSALTAAELDLLIRGVEALGGANFGGWQEDEIEMDRVLKGIFRSEELGPDQQRAYCLPALTAAQLDLLIRGIEALGGAHYRGWQEDEREIRRLLQNIRWK